MFFNSDSGSMGLAVDMLVFIMLTTPSFVEEDAWFLWGHGLTQHLTEVDQLPKILCPGKKPLDQSATRLWNGDDLDGRGANARMRDLSAEQILVVGED